MLARVLLAALVLCAGPALAANKFVRAGAGGSGTGADWTNAYTALPASLTRGDTYYIADGSYSGYTFDDANSGTTVTTIKKCSTSDGVSSGAAGYSSAYCDGQAVFSGTFTFNSDYWTVDGAYRNESDWGDGDAYGIRATGVRSSTGDAGVCAANVIVRYLNMGGTESDTYTGSEVTDTVYQGGFAELCTTWTIERTYQHNVKQYTMIQFAGTDGMTVQYNLFKNGWGKETIRGQNTAKNIIIRWNKFHNACGNSGGAGEGCTAEIALWDGSSGGFDGNQVYGNTFYRTRDENSGGTIVIGGNGGSWAGPSASNVLVYNNTIAGIAGASVGALILINGGTGNVCRNNLWYDVIGTGSCTASTTSNNTEVGSDPFVSYATGDLRLSGATTAGYTLSSPYNTDMLGNTRGGDGTWDVGAYEYGSGSRLPGPGNPRWRPADAWPLWFAWWGR